MTHDAPDARPDGGLLSSTTADGGRVLGIVLLELGGVRLTHTLADGDETHVHAAPFDAVVDAIAESGVVEASKTRHAVFVNTDREVAQAALLLAHAQHPSTFDGIDRLLLVDVSEGNLLIRREHYDRTAASDFLSHTYTMAFEPPSDASNDEILLCQDCPVRATCRTGWTGPWTCPSCAYYRVDEEGMPSCSLFGHDLDAATMSKEWGCHVIAPWLTHHEAVYDQQGRIRAYRNPTTGQDVPVGQGGVASRDLAGLMKLASAFKGEVRQC